MNILYMTKASDVKQFLRKIVKKRKRIRGGRARGCRVKFYFLQFTIIFYNLQPRAETFPN